MYFQINKFNTDSFIIHILKVKAKSSVVSINIKNITINNCSKYARNCNYLET